MIKKMLLIVSCVVCLLTPINSNAQVQTSGRWHWISFQTFSNVEYLVFTLSNINTLKGYDIEYNCSNLDSDTWVFFDSFANRISYRLLIRVDGNDPRLCGNDHAHIFRSRLRP